MARLEVRLLGPFEATVDGQPVTAFETEAARALLAFLASEPGRPRTRPVVAEMLWPDRPEGAARSNLRHVLSVLRRALGDADTARPLLVADRTTVSLDASAGVWVDLVEFEHLAATPPGSAGVVEAWQDGVDLWRGPLLDGLAVRAGAEWEEWLIVTAERARRQLATALRRLADHHQRTGAWELAIPLARRLTEVDPWEERAHRQLMQLLAGSGDRPRALAHFADLAERLRAELGSKPAPETVALADQIRVGDLAAVAAGAEIAYPPFFAIEETRVRPAFVGRQRELEGLRVHLDAALAGKGGVVFVAGEAGSGKTMLAGEFMRLAAGAADLLTARGRCNAFGGLGDPYLPFREVLGLLCGDVEAAYTAGALDREQATRLWEAIPHTARLVAELGPDLLGVMINAGLLVERAEQALPGARWIEDLHGHVEARRRRASAPERLQPALFDEYTAVLERLSITRPLLLVVDDLQWADRGSIALLWHLARRIEGMRVLLVGLYRPEEVTARPGEGIALADVLRELQAGAPDRTIELAGHRGFVDEFLDSEPNALDTGFRDRLFAYTSGHPLFTVELVRGMQERAEIHRDRAGVWQARESLDWDRLPSRVEAVVAQRIARLPEGLRRDLAVASVQGEEFIAEIVAAVRADPDAPGRLSLESTTPQRLIEPAGVTRIDGRLAARHRFRHILFQRYLYDRLDRAELLRLHEATGRALEDLYGDHADLPVVELARHFDEAGLADPATGYLYEAGQRALRMSAQQEAIGLLERALALLRTLPDSPDRDRRELDVLVALGSALMAVRGYAAPEAQDVGARIREICDRLDPSPATGLALLLLASVLSVRGFYEQSLSVCSEALDVAGKLGDTALRATGYRFLGYNQTFVADLAAGHDSLQAVERLYDPVAHAWLTYAFGGASGPEALVWDAVNTVHRGYPDQAIRLGDRGIAVARELGHRFTLCHCLAIGGSLVRQMCGDYRAVPAFIDEVEEIAAAEHFAFYEVAAALHRGNVAGHLGDPETGIATIGPALEAWQAMGVGAFRGWFHAEMAGFERALGNHARGLELVAGALDEARTSGEGLTVPFVLLVRGTLLGVLGDEPAAVDALEQAMELAHSAGARWYELQAATRLAELWERRGDAGRAGTILTPVYSWFTEGFDTPHLVAARTLLERL